MLVVEQEHEPKPNAWLDTSKVNSARHMLYQRGYAAL